MTDGFRFELDTPVRSSTVEVDGQPNSKIKRVVLDAVAGNSTVLVAIYEYTSPVTINPATGVPDVLVRHARLQLSLPALIEGQLFYTDVPEISRDSVA